MSEPTQVEGGAPGSGHQSTGSHLQTALHKQPKDLCRHRKFWTSGRCTEPCPLTGTLSLLQGTLSQGRAGGGMTFHASLSLVEGQDPRVSSLEPPGHLHIHNGEGCEAKGASDQAPEGRGRRSPGGRDDFSMNGSMRSTAGQEPLPRPGRRPSPPCRPAPAPAPRLVHSQLSKGFGGEGPSPETPSPSPALHTNRKGRAG